MPLTFRLRNSLPLPIDLADLRLEELQAESTLAIARRKIWYGNRSVAAGELFDISGSAQSDGTWIFSGDCHNVKSIGAGLTRGVLRVEDNAGMHLGAEIRGGEIVVEGNVDDWAGAEMRGGRIFVHGRAGHQLGGAYRGSRKGMTGGEILVLGSAGDEVGRCQRRGLIAVGGSTGTGTGFGMIAGTILVGGDAGACCGAGMKRGSIILLDPRSSEPQLSSFQRTASGTFVFLQLYFRYLQAAGFPISTEVSRSEFHMDRGDLLELGKGEILRRAIS